MTDPVPKPAVSNPRWDGKRILFEVTDGDSATACTISVNALQDLTGQRRFKPADLLACFAGARARIGAIALDKLRAKATSTSGLLYIWSDDIDEPSLVSPPTSKAKAKALRVA